MRTITDTTFTLEPAEAEEIATTAMSLAHKYSSVTDPELVMDLPLLAAQLPFRVQRFLREFTVSDSRGYCVVSGHKIDQKRIGPTPAHWRGRQRPGPEFPEEILLLLYSALLGEPFGWSTQQDGHLVHDIFPILAHEHDQLGMGSKELLTWHVEDAFHPYRSDFLVLAALRNDDLVPTTVGELDVSQLDPTHVDVLFEERFFIAPDESHLPKNNSQDSDGDLSRFRTIQRLIDERKPVALLFGSPEDPYIRLDPYFTEAPEDDLQAKEAYEALVKLIDENLEPVVAGTGDFLFINNHRAVHGRLPFTARYDGTDRWLKRSCVTTDLRKSRDMRAAAESRLLG